MSTRRGATLLVTLGILTVVSVMAVTFLVTARLRQQSVAAAGHRLAARNHLNEALYLAMSTIEDAFCHTNFTDAAFASASDSPVPRRLAPVGRWFSDEWENRRGKLSDKFSYWAPGVLTVPISNHTETLQAAWSVNLLTPEVLALVPPVLTNGLPLSSSDSRPLRSGWELIDAPSPDHNGVRVAFAIFDVSGFLDANTFITGPTTQKLPRVCFSQADITNWFANVDHEKISTLKSQIPDLGSNPNRLPFSTLSYDPDPEADPLRPDRADSHPYLGYDSYRRTHQSKFDLHSFTNLIEKNDAASGDWLLAPQLISQWILPVVLRMNRMRAAEPENHPDRLEDLQLASLPWTIINFIDSDRIPQVSLFDGIDLATRHNFAIEDVPLINKIAVFNLYDEDGSGVNHDAPQKPGFYDLPSSGLSNHYAVAVELWYPFAPNRPPEYAALYAALFTNEADVVTTTNRPLNESELRDWFRWNDAASSNSVMKTLFYAWADSYTRAVGSEIADHPLWQTVTEQSDLWFTPAMTNHPSWPIADTNGVFSLTNTPIWQAFYPETYDAITTNNLTEQVVTNTYTYHTVTNTTLLWITEPDPVTNRFETTLGTTDPGPYPMLLWSGPDGSSLTTNVLGAFVNTAGVTNRFVEAGLTNHLLSFTPQPDGIALVLSNSVSGVVSTHTALMLDLAPWDASEWVFTPATSLMLVTEILPVAPLPMPETLSTSLAVLLSLLPTETLNGLYSFLLLRPDEFNDEAWGALFSYLNLNPLVLRTLTPSRREPTLGNMTEKDRFPLTDGTGTPKPYESDESGRVDVTGFRTDGFGRYWTVYPKKTVAFPEITIIEADQSVSGQREVITNYIALGKNGNRLWLQPTVTINTNRSTAMSGDAIVDEALLTRGGESVQGWSAVTNLSIADPRHNAYAAFWRPVHSLSAWKDELGTTNRSTEVTEYPFIQLNTPLHSIADLGHVYTSPDRLRLTHTFLLGNATASPDLNDKLPRHDTIAFVSRSGAGLLDVFTIHPTNRPPWRGLVQANTHHEPVIQTLFSFGKLGWTNTTEGGKSFLSDLSDVSDLSDWSDAFRDALANTPPTGIGWRSFADMLPAISTNELLRTSFTPPFNDAPAHDWIEDAVRHLPDLVSFRQNIFVIVIAAQTLSPASTPSRPVVLADQRAAVTVIRDAFTGRWTVHDWRWLTE